MFNVKIAAVAAAVGFVLSFLISFLSHARFPQLLVRPVFFGFLFFVCGSGFYFLIKKFLQELLQDEAGGEVNISVGDDDDEDGFDTASLVGGGAFVDGAMPDMADGGGGLAQNADMPYTTLDAGTGGKAFAELAGNVDGGRRADRGNTTGAFTKVSSDSPFEDADPKRVAGAIKNLLMDD